MWPIYFRFYGDTGFYIIYDIIPMTLMLYYYKLIFTWLKKVKGFLLSFIFVYILTLLWAFISATINDNYDFSYFDFLFRIIQNLMLYVFIILIHYKILGIVTIKSFFRYFVFSDCAYILSTILFLLYPEFKDWWINLLANGADQQTLIDVFNYQTRFGLKGFSNFCESAMCSLGVLSSLYLMHKSKTVFSVWGITLYICMLGCLFYGRVGIITSLMFIVFYEILDTDKESYRRMIFFLISSALLVVAIVFLVNYDIRLEYWINWVSDPVKTFLTDIQYGQVSFGYSADRLVNDMYFVPDNKTLLYGDAHYHNSDGTYYMHTDAGIMRHILYFGVLGELLGYLLLLIPVFYLVRVFYNNDKSSLYMIALFVPFFIFFEIKGVVYNSFFGWLIAILILSVNEDTYKVIKK